MTRVLIVEDEPSFVEALEVALAAEGFDTEAAMDGKAGLERFRAQRPDLVLLDLMLPSLPGLDVLRAIRRDSDVPVVVVSAKDAEADIVAALELGADDYVTKPYSVRELVARIRAAGRRTVGSVETETLALGGASLDTGSLKLRLGDVDHDLPKKEFEVLQMLMQRPGKVVTREEFLDEVWGFAWIGDTRTLDQHIRRIRRRLETDPAAPQIETVRGVGYRLVEGER
ncbi:MAG: response regulator transcription factor [Actinobacteria bacterium]|nr:response regulator transcription factor [Actinomycetota bacterium]